MATYTVEIKGEDCESLKGVINSLKDIVHELKTRPEKWINAGTYFHGEEALKLSIIQHAD